jgi:regulator of protease activity HflC (stomatin/prohibitin superfamily)
MKVYFRFAGLGLACIFALMIFFGGWYTVNQGDRALVLRFGRVVETSGPGFHFKVPFMDGVEKISVRTRKTENTLMVYSRDI